MVESQISAHLARHDCLLFSTTVARVKCLNVNGDAHVVITDRAMFLFIPRERLTRAHFSWFSITQVKFSPFQIRLTDPTGTISLTGESVSSLQPAISD
jgi:hypothetical protein